jgi:hypothetical protein
LKEESRINWRWGVLVTLTMTLLSLYPHLHFRVSRGANWNGSYAAIEGVGDEVAYSAYVNALIDGRPRRNDPYSGRDDTVTQRQPESLFSIQFVPAYLIATVARIFGMSAASAFVVLTPVAAALTSLVLFWFLAMATRDDSLAAAGTLAVLCLGTVVGGHGLFAGFFGGEPFYNYLMFLRRYQPSASFPVFILFFAVVWRTSKAPTWSSRMLMAGLSGFIFGLLVYSYVFLWTAAAAWLFGLGVIWIIARPEGWKLQLKAIAVIAGFSSLTLIPLMSLYANRAASLDSVQALEASHIPDLLRLPELLAVAVLILVLFLVRRKVVDPRSSNVLFAISFATLPLLVFNQQVLSGKSLQPLHYEMFVANYSVLIALVLVMGMMVKRRFEFPKVRRKAVLLLAVAAFEWGAYETYVATKRSMEFAGRFDEARPVALRLDQLSNTKDRGVILSSDLLAADVLPTTASNPVLWAPHMMVFSGVSTADSKERFYQYLYYTGITPERLENILRKEREYGFTAGLFGFERTIKGLSLNPKPITRAELDDELRRYARYCSSFSRETAGQTELSYLMTPVNEGRDLANLDRWYERDGGERIGNFNLYRLRLRDNYASLNTQTRKQAGPR